jgi:hypothetical protein
MNTVFGAVFIVGAYMYIYLYMYIMVSYTHDMYMYYTHVSRKNHHAK